MLKPERVYSNSGVNLVHKLRSEMLVAIIYIIGMGISPFVLVYFLETIRKHRWHYITDEQMYDPLAIFMIGIFSIVWPISIPVWFMMTLVNIQW